MQNYLALVTTLSLAIPATAHAATGHNIARSRSLGTSEWGVGYTATSKTAYTQAGPAGTAGDRLRINQSLTGWIRMFGDEDDLIDLRGSGTNVLGGERTYHVGLYANILGEMVELWGADNELTNVIAMDDSLSRTFASAEAKFWGVLKVKATARGEVGYNAFGGFTDTHVGVNFKPYVRAVARGTFSVDLLVAEAGVYGEIELIDASVPIHGHLAAATTCAGFRSDVGLASTVEAGAGEFGAFVRLIGWGSRDYELFGFPPVATHTTDLFSTEPVVTCF